MYRFSINWLRVVYFNLMIVAFIGVILRYKIAFSLPFIQQKNLLHGHSHFAFAGWVTQTLLFLLLKQLKHEEEEKIFKKYRWLLIGNLIAAWGMLLSFPFQGYGVYSISFSTLSIFISYIFAIFFWKDLNKQREKTIGGQVIKVALIFNILSSLGAFSLAAMMIKKIIIQKWSLLAIYFFLHFQYNGWFFFSCLGLLFLQLEKASINTKKLQFVFILFASACIPAYFLSALWLPIPFILYALILLAAVAQAWAWIILIKLITAAKKTILFFQTKYNYILVLVAIAFSIKLMLQLGSIIPQLSQVAFGFRPIIIGYLHLVLLAITSLFITGYFLKTMNPHFNKTAVTGIHIFVGGIILNELLLLVQGVSDMAYILVPFINEGLFIAALVLFSGIFIINYGLQKNSMNL
jgi:hypothetical protein